jgi:hypothetical protein
MSDVSRVSPQGGGMTLFDGWPEAERTIAVPDTLETRIMQFCHRNAYNTTQLERLEAELRELLHFAKEVA